MEFANDLWLSNDDGHDVESPSWMSPKWLCGDQNYGWDTFSPIIMEVEHGGIWKVTTIGGTHFSLPWLSEEGYDEIRCLQSQVVFFCSGDDGRREPHACNIVFCLKPHLTWNSRYHNITQRAENISYQPQRWALMAYHFFNNKQTISCSTSTSTIYLQHLLFFPQPSSASSPAFGVAAPFSTSGRRSRTTSILQGLRACGA